MNSAMFAGMPRCWRPTKTGRFKWRFRSELAALMVAHGFARRESDVLHVYRCPWCDGWHTTRQDQKLRKPDRTCECGATFRGGVGYEAHLREEHGWLTVHMRPGGGIRYVPIMSHPKLGRAT